MAAVRALDPLAASRPQVELYVRWMQEVRRLKPSTVSRRMSIVAGFYRTAVVDGLLEHSPADHVRRPTVPAESPTLGLTHLQLECAGLPPRLLGLRIFEATGLNVGDLGEEHGHRVLRVVGKGDKTVLIPLPPAVSRAVDSAIGDRTARPVLLNTRGARMDRHAATRRLRALAHATGMRMPPIHPTCSATPTSPPCSTPASTSATSKSPPATPTPAPPCATTEPATTSTATPNYILAAYMASGT